ncbi:PRPL22 [Auxenochlorella protothecoides x Auxenochlorella symbiontica]|uniref:Large ribosomal subunit protein uL22c n=1 Tax=Auxenochlorella protothecoides TaxID=3075 RepID=A0A1D2A6N9_AUXPR|nr:hypothetical protein APUTEX25_005717 [Auxenochlorella protothecoides]|eukprot:RMZ55091.1 hypothetical protein APUTEX25_005717 [Auxenochlorella protothecoides]
MATLGSVSPVGVPAACRLPRLATAFRPFTPTAARAMPLMQQQQQSAQRLARPLTRLAASSSPDALATGSPPPADTAAKEPALKGEAHLRFVRGSPLKVRRVLDQIRGRSYEEAIMILEYMPYRACEPILATLLSAAANAKHNLGAKKAALFVHEAFADGGPSMKRAMPRAQGRADRILKPTFHLTIRLQTRAGRA